LCGVARVVDAVFVKDKRVSQRADLEQPMPVGRVARQARDLESEHDLGVAHADLAHELLEAFSVDARRTGLAKVGVDHVHPLDGPAERHRSLTQGVLAPGALGVVEDLPHRGLAYVRTGTHRGAGGWR
jgi:hypothetical protein